MTIETILLKYIAKQYSISEEEIAELLYEKSEDGKINVEKIKDSALQSLLDKDQQRVTDLKESVDKTEIFTQAQKKAKKEVLEKEEKRLAKKYGVDKEGIKMDELVQSIIEKESQAAVEAAEGDLNEDKVKAHPTYLALERTKTEDIQKLTDDHKKTIEEIQDSHVRNETLQTVKSQVLNYFDGFKPVLSKDTTKATNQRENFAKMFEGYEYKGEEGQDEHLIMKDGKRLEDGHGNPISLKDFTFNLADKYYDFSVQDPKGAPGNGGDGGGGDGGAKVPKTEAEYNTMIIEASTTEERASIVEAWEASGGSSE